MAKFIPAVISCCLYCVSAAQFSLVLPLRLIFFVPRLFRTSPSGPQEAVLFLFRFLFSGRSPTRPVHLYPRRPCFTSSHPLVPHRLLTPPIIVGGLTATVEGQRVPPWQAWGLSVLSATIHAKSPSKFSLPALFLNQPLAVILGLLGLLGLLGPRPLGLPGLPV